MLDQLNDLQSKVTTNSNDEANDKHILIYVYTSNTHSPMNTNLEQERMLADTNKTLRLRVITYVLIIHNK